jgi:vacuolar-type H+-ATPase subunit F/Vma7
MGDGVELISGFTATQTIYAVDAENSVEIVIVSAETAAPLSEAVYDDTVTLSVGSNQIDIVVTAEDGNTKTYYAIVNRIPLPSIASFTFSAGLNGLDEDLTGVINEIDEDNAEIVFSTQKWLENIDRFIASFESAGNVTVNDIPQTSGVTANDFRKEILYTVTSGMIEKVYTVRFDAPQATGLPVIKIDVEDGLPIVSKENYLDADIRIIDPNNENYNLEATTEIRGRGNSTWNFAKKPYRLKLSKKEGLFGLKKAKSWVLLADFLDTTRS